MRCKISSDRGCVVNITQSTSLVFIAIPKHSFCHYSQISSFVLHQGYIPLNSFQLFSDLNGVVSDDSILAAYGVVLGRCDAVWTFGDIDDDILIQISLARKLGKSVRQFLIEYSSAKTVFRERIIDGVNRVN